MEENSDVENDPSVESSVGLLDIILLIVTVAIIIMLIFKYRKRKTDDNVADLRIDPSLVHLCSL